MRTEMSKLPPHDQELCTDVRSSTASIEDMNRQCFCVSVDLDAVHVELQKILQPYGQVTDLRQSHPHLFASLPVYVSRGHLERIREVVVAIEEVVKSPAYQSAVMAWAPQIARFDPGSPGGLLGIDFHLSPEGPKLIEINTNPGGALLNTLLSQAQKVCAPDRMVPPTDPVQAEQQIFATLLAEWESQRGHLPLASVAIVDETPRQQYLHPEFLLYCELLRKHGVRADIRAPEDVVIAGGRVFFAGESVDMVYNRMTDFALQQPMNAALREAYLERQIVLSPHPRAHALYADKRNLSLIGDRSFLQSLGISQTAVNALSTAVPTTTLLTPENHEAMWVERRKLFFKPAAGFGSKASYRGDKLTRRIWSEILRGTYVAQQIVPPSERSVAGQDEPLKIDIRTFAYGGDILLYAARIYRGQTTNFRTFGGGFAPVLTDASTH
ncbi:MAG: hypothetical protein EPN69_10255 [Rhodanobacter sp.]|nr:MAG: hypothetical protein EPN69_10255 [Rhodanobacter sp.]TAM04583.1 MAG: hypothetical protein EPN71_02615 [Rhodanobacter sp.]TAM42179.1 MAG: hypothetical protein EPN58_04030 [Rhodanobacter sp.]TAN26838.1 MAG: hypothetical protein EPN32_05900 [Rhodanobacter sp.]